MRINPILADEIFALNDNLSYVYEEGVITVDNWYRDIQLICEVLENVSANAWKWNPNGRNFKDYQDCRFEITNKFPGVWHRKTEEVIKYLISQFFNETRDMSLVNTNYEFNAFKPIVDVNQSYQMHPHIDHNYNIITYIDGVEDGGTALYEVLPERLRKNTEHENLLVDISESEFKIIPAKQNRTVIFKGDVYHAGYINDYSFYKDNWRVTQVNFLR